MGDHAVSIAEATIRMKGEVRIPTVEEEINKMGRQVRQLVEAVLDLYLHKCDSDQAYDIAAKDELINQYFDQIRELATEEIKKAPDSIVTGRDYFQVISYLERIVTTLKIFVNGSFILIQEKSPNCKLFIQSLRGWKLSNLF